MIQVFAPAKVNLALYVGPVRDDGLHELVSLAVKIPLYDILMFSPSSKLEITMHGPDIPIEENLVYRAVRAFEELCGIRIGLKIEVVKRIPPGAGLGGGSSDAAAVLKTLTFLSGCVPSYPDISVRAFGLGADVPLFLTPYNAVMFGAGEDVLAIPWFRPPPMVIILPKWDMGLETKSVFEAYDRLTRRKSKVKLHRRFGHLRAIFEEFARRADQRLVENSFFYNDLEPVVRGMTPELAPVQSKVKEYGAVTVLTSGAGPTVIGVFESPGMAAFAASRIRRKFPYSGVLVVKSGVRDGRLRD